MATRSTRRDPEPVPWGDELPLVGRRADRDALRLLLDDAVDGKGHTLLLTGESGVGKSRLLADLAREALAREMLVASGRAFTVEAAVPFGAFADALTAPLLALDAGTLTVLARGTEDDLRVVVPALPRGAAGARTASSAESDGKTRLFWNVAQFLTRLAKRQPLLLVLDNAHWSDPSSLELLHFLARQIRDAPVLLVLAYADIGPDENATLRGVERSLLGSGEATHRQIVALTRHDLVELLQRVFVVPREEAERHATPLFEHTRGNSFFLEQSLKALLGDGRITWGDGRWVIADMGQVPLPTTVREVVRSRFDALGADARRVAEIASIKEGRASLDLLRAVSGLEADAFVVAIEELGQRRILVEQRTAESAAYEFSHPILQSTLRGELSAARERALHESVTLALEKLYGERAVSHATEIAQHMVRGQVSGADDRALHYLAAAGRDALARRADQEAARWIAQALAIAERMGDTAHAAALLEELGTAHQRLGDRPAAREAWRRALEFADAAGGELARARLLYQMGLEASRAGEAEEALRCHDETERAAARVGRPDLVIGARLLRLLTLQTLGQHAEATATLREVLPMAAALGDRSVLARVHQTALQLYAWTGPTAAAREHGATALKLAAEAGDREVAWRAHWSLAMLEGLTGEADGVARHVREAARLAEELSSPFLQAMTAEIQIEHASAVGRWNEGVALAERTIPLARAVSPQALLPRVLIWTGLMVLARDEMARARALFEEAWQLTGAESVSGSDGANVLGANIQNVILAHVGMGSYHLARGAWASAHQLGTRGLALADQFGLVAWAIHRLIPLVLEAGLYLQRFDEVEALTRRLREESRAFGHRLGLAWSTAADALLVTFKHRAPDAPARLIAAAEELEAIPFPFHAARLRRSAAVVFESAGDSESAIRELRLAHDVFARLGAETELRETRSQLRSLGVRLPPRTATEGVGALTGRELEIARAVARGLANKEIGAMYGISSRTVSTHLSHIFEKLGVKSRGALADRVRTDPLLSGA